MRRFADWIQVTALAFGAPGLFVVAFVLCGVLLVVRTLADAGSPSSAAQVMWAVGPYLLGAWCTCRAYYFGFYVITAYCDRGSRYAGVLSAVRWVGRGGAQ